MKYKQQRNKVNNLKKQAKKKFYGNINENGCTSFAKILKKKGYFSFPTIFFLHFRQFYIGKKN
jgi:hypothetical protein